MARSVGRGSGAPLGTAPRGARPQPDLATLYLDHVQAVSAYAHRRLPEADAEDLASEVFRAAAEQLERHPDSELSRPWLLTVARNLAIDRWRARTRWEQRVTLLRRDLDAEREWPESDGGGDDVVRTLNTLPPDQRIVLLLRYVEGLHAREVATVMGRSASAVDSLLARARRAFLVAFAART